MKNLFKWLRNFYRFIRDYDHTLERLKTAEHKAKHAQNLASEAVQIIKDRTELGADIHFTKHATDTVILCGRYKRGDFVEVYNVTHEDFAELIQMLRQMQRHARLKYVDGPPQMKAFINRDLGN